MGTGAEEDLRQFEGGYICKGEVDYSVEATLNITDSGLDCRVLTGD